MRAAPPFRVLWVPYAQRGSIYPIVPVVQALDRIGADITLLGLSALEPLAKTLSVHFAPYHSGISYDWSHPDGCDRHELGPENGADWFHHRVAAEFAEVERALRTLRPDLLLVDSFVIGAGLAAEADGIPWASYVHYLFDEGAETDAMHRIWWEKEKVPEIDAYAAWWDGIRRAVGLGPETRGRQEAPWFRMSPLCTFLLGNPRLRRGARPLPGFVTRTSLPPWDEAGQTSDSNNSGTPPKRSRVLVANSSAWQDDADLVYAALAGLADMDVDVVVTVSARHILNTDPPSNATMLGYCPHTSMLPSVDAVVTTSGYGITSKALWYGRPLVAIPRARDQHYVAAAVEQAGCGLTVAWPPTADTVVASVSAVLSSPEIQGRARDLSGPLPGFPSAPDVAARLLSLAKWP